MSIKKLFESTDKSKNYLTSQNRKDAFKNVESGRNVSALREKQKTFIPQIDYSNPENFARYGSAYLYYESSIDRIIDYYPYDGSDAEINEYYNKSLDIEKYVFNNLYPRTNGYAILCADGYGSSTAGVDGYDVPATQEHITFYGGPGTASATTNKKDLFNNPKDSKFQYSNVYDTDIYTTEGLPSDYGSGSRESNLKADFNRGVTVEFWMKSGSMAPSSETTRKQVVFDMWNNNVDHSASGDYGRLRIMMTGTNGSGGWLKASVDSGDGDTPFYVTAVSGAITTARIAELIDIYDGSGAGGGFYQFKIGKNLTADDNWHHYAFVVHNSGSDAKLSLYVDGRHNDTRTMPDGAINTLNSKNMVGRIGALVTAPEGSNALTGSAKLNASIDEFRFWKVRRSAEEIGRNYFTQIRGGVNTDISNTTLGMYYKFNEGITGESATDSVVLDYSGRVVNGVWSGYGSNSRNTGSAIISASAATSEYEDPIIRSNHPQVVSLKADLLYSGSYHDDQNNSSMKNMVPGWILDEQDDQRDTNLNKVAHIMGAYFDKLYLQIQAIPSFRNLEYTSASFTPLPFAQHLPQSLGLYSPDLFIDSNVVERFKNRNENSVFESDLAETKNLIYLNLYNNLANIFKSKGTEKSIRNVFRCMNIDDRLVRFNTYFRNQTYTLDNTMQQTLVEKSFLNLHESNSIGGVVYQRSSSYPHEANNRHNGSGFVRGHEAQQKYGMTLEADVMFPAVYKASPKIHRTYQTASIFGMVEAYTGSSTVNTADGHVLTGSLLSMTGSRTTWLASDKANFQVYAIRPDLSRDDAYFAISSSIDPWPFPTLTSSVFPNVYDNENWNISVRLKPMAVPKEDSRVHMGQAVAPTIISGSDFYDYQLEFRGINAELGVIKNSFLLTASLGQKSGSQVIVAGKRVQAGAYRFNTTGAVIHPSDVQIAGVRYWTKYIDDIALDQHVYDVYNQGVSGSYFQLSPLDGGQSSDKYGNFENYNYGSLALSWDFAGVTGSNDVGNFEIVDISSGSAEMSASYGWIGLVAGQQHPGEAYGFDTSATNVTLNRKVNAFQFVDPEFAVSSDMINILSDDDKIYGIVEDVPDYFFSLEKSMYRAISDEMLTFFAGIVDFNNIIGEAVNRYRMNYKALEKLRQVFFEKVNNVKRVEQYIEYYKWFDDAISDIVEQLVPASAKFNSDVMNVVESHVLERNKYQNKFPTFEFKQDNLETSMNSVFNRNLPYARAGAPVTLEEMTLAAHDIWSMMYALGDEELISILSSGDDEVDTARRAISRIKSRSDTGALLRALEGFASSLQTTDGESYGGDIHVKGVGMPAAVMVLAAVHSDYRPDEGAGAHGHAAEYHTSPVGMERHGRWLSIHGGVNFPPSKNIGFSDNALRPFGPVNRENKVFVPTNVLFSPIEDFTKFNFFHRAGEVQKKTKRIIKVHHGRNWQNGEGLFNLKSTMAYPFNIMSSSVKSGFNKEVVEKVTGAIEITNLHFDHYGKDLEIPMQGTYTQRHIGGHQSRHVPLNTNATDSYLDRPERWKILLGKCPGVSGAMGMVGPDYPYPETNDQQVAIPTVTGEYLDNNQTILWPDKAHTDNRGNCLVVQATSSAGQDAAAALIFDNNLVGSANEFPVWTFSAWVNPSGSSNSARIVWQAGRTSGGNYGMHTITIEGDESLRYNVVTSVNAGAGSERNVFWETAAGTITEGSWNHIVVKVTGTIGSLSTTLQPTFYINGVSRSFDGGSSPSNTPYNNLPNGKTGKSSFRGHSGWTLTPPVLIGGDLDNGNFEEYYGAIDEVAVWNSHLTDAQVTNIYNSGAPNNLTASGAPASSSLIAWWRMGEGPRFGNSDGLSPGSTSTDAISATNIVRDLVGSASLMATAVDTYDMNLNIVPSTLANSDDRVTTYQIMGPLPYPITGAQNAVYYRDRIAKRPVSLKNILVSTASEGSRLAGIRYHSPIGNYRGNFEVLQVGTAYEQPRKLTISSSQVIYPQSVRDLAALHSKPRGKRVEEYTVNTTNINNFLNIRRNAAAFSGATNAGDKHLNWDLDYAPLQTTGSMNKSIVIQKFSHGAGGAEVKSRGFLDIRGGQFSPYSALTNRNLSVLKRSQGPSGTLQDPGFLGVGNESVAGMRVEDIHNLDYGLRSHLARHTAKFGRDSLARPIVGYDLKTDISTRGHTQYTYNKASSLQGWWRLNEDVSDPSDGDVIDSSGNSRNGTFDASGDRPAFANTLYPGELVQTASNTFDGNNDAVNIGAGSLWQTIIGTGTGGTEKMTFSIWLRKTGDGGGSGFGRIFGFGRDSTDGQIAIYTNASEQIIFKTDWDGGNSNLWGTGLAFSLDTWTHLAITYDAGSTANDPIIYVNGIPISLTINASPSGNWDGIDSSENCYIGNDSLGSTGWEGQLADAAIWNSILSESDIKALVQAANYSTEIVSGDVPVPGETYNQLPGFHKTHRNNIPRLVQKTFWPFPETFENVQQNDNFFVQHPIPRSDRQYAWVTNSLDVNPTALGQTTPDDLRYYGYAPVYGHDAGLHSSSAGGWVSYFSYVTASSVTEHLKNTSNQFSRITNQIQPTYPLNIFTVDPFTGSTNTLGQPLSNASSSLNGWYINNELVDKIGVSLGNNQELFNAHYLNLLLTRRGLSNGWDWKKTRLYDHPIMLKERKSNELTLLNSKDDSLSRYILRPVTTRGRTALINFQNDTVNSTIRLVSDNEEIYFNEPELDNITGIDLRRVKTPFEQVSGLLKRKTNWILYTQNIFPSLRNEFSSGTTQRLNYDNKFWAKSNELRTDIGSASGSFPVPLQSSFSSSQKMRLGFNSQAIQVSQSCWPLDAPKNFLTRSHPLIAGVSGTDKVAGQLRHSGSGGELQNEYTLLMVSGAASQVGSLPSIGAQILGISAKFARPHLLSSPWSVVARSGVRIYETGSGDTTGGSTYRTPAGSRIPGSGDESGIAQQGTTTADPAFDSRYQIDMYGGEALWEANTNAGIVIKEGSGERSDFSFESHPSDPWFDTYDDFKYELGLIAKDYSIVPEFRISEHIEDYIKGGLFNPGKQDWLEIPGAKDFRNANINSSTSSFYKDYSNSEFIKDFVKVAKTTKTEPREFMLVVTAAIRFNPYNGFYPAQRTLDMVSQFSKSYGESLVVKTDPNPFYFPDGIIQSEELITRSPGALRPLYQAMFAPGILYNSIKSGMAVDYPVVTDPHKVKISYFSGSAEWAMSGNTDQNGTMIDRQQVGPYRWDAMSTKRGRNNTGNWALTNFLSADKGVFDTGTGGSTPPGTPGSRYVFTTPLKGYAGGPWFDKRIPFEAIIRPEDYLKGVDFVDLEPHPSASMRNAFGVPGSGPAAASVPLTSSLGGASDRIYTMMSRNFFGEMGKFFLKDETYSSLRSSIVPNDLRFPSGSIFGSRFKTYRSTTARIYSRDSGSAGNGNGFSERGATVISGGAYVPGAWYPIPQDPKVGCHETFTMYSRPSAFGPPIAGRPDFRIMSGTINLHGVMDKAGAYLNPLSMSYSGAMDCFSGYNWAYTPPYYHGEAWCDFIFIPDPAKSYDLEQILAETKTVYTRVDPGPLSGINTGDKKNSAGQEVIGISPTLIIGSPNVWSNTSSYATVSANEATRPAEGNHRPPYAGDNVNANAMQVSASFNLFGVERVTREALDPDTKEVRLVGGASEVGKRWIIKPKFETPMFNFNNTDGTPRPISAEEGSLTLPLFASASVPRGIWHQYGIIEPDPRKGIFMEIGPIPDQWIRNHYNATTTASIYNNYNELAFGEGGLSGGEVASKMQSLTDIVGFPRTEEKTRLGELKDYQTLREAIVAVPYTITSEPFHDFSKPFSTEEIATRKKFFTIPREVIDAARDDLVTAAGDHSLETAGRSIRSLVKKMQRYALPPWLDFLNIEEIDPIVMYMIEFEYELDRDDLAYIAQNIAPKDSKKITIESRSTAHKIRSNELMGINDILTSDELRWMVFKVKQKSQSDYYDHVVPQVGEGGSKTLDIDSVSKPHYKLSYNWPYDYVSFVEMIKLDAEVLFKNKK